MKRSVWLCLSMLTWLAGCATVPTEAPVVRANDMSKAGPLLGQQPFWIQFEPGDEVPVYIDVSSTLLEAKPKEPVVVRVKRRFYLLMSEDMPRFSYDRRVLLDGSGSFRFGIGATKERDTFAELVVRHRVGP